MYSCIAINNKKKWTDEDKEFLINNYLTMTDSEIGKILNRSASAVSKTRQILKLYRKTNKPKRYDDILIIDNPKEKKCKICNRIFPNTSEYFYRDRNKLRSHCKECNKKKQSQERRNQGAFTKEFKQSKLDNNLAYCGRCKLWKDINKFRVNHNDINQIHRWCEECESNYLKEYYLQNTYGDNYKEAYFENNKHLYDLNNNKCDSIPEKIISDWFIENGIKNEKYPRYKDYIENEHPQKKFDWLIYVNGEKYFVEYFGLWDNKARNNYLHKYTKKAKKKIKLLYKNNLHHKTIFIFPSDLKNKTLDDIFYPILEK